MADVERDAAGRDGESRGVAGRHDDVADDRIARTDRDRPQRDRSGRFLPCVDKGTAARSTGRRPAGAGGRRGKARKPVAWSMRRETMFIETLAETSNVAASIRASGLSPSNVYRRRCTSAEFRAKWGEALREGYARLQGDLLERALNGVEKPVFFGGKKIGMKREFNDRIALALLAHHRATVMGAQPTAVAEGFRIEAWLRIDAADGGLRVACGAGEAVWIGCQGNDLKCCIGGNTAAIQTFANALPTGSWTHIALTCDAPGLTYTVHVDGVQRGTAYATTTDYDGSSNVFGVRTFGGVGGFELTSQSIDEVAIWRSIWPAAIVPSSAYGGSEAGLLGLWHLQGNGANSASG